MEANRRASENSSVAVFRSPYAQSRHVYLVRRRKCRALRHGYMESRPQRCGGCLGIGTVDDEEVRREALSRVVPRSSVFTVENIVARLEELIDAADRARN
jgi:hypothetical protein